MKKSGEAGRPPLLSKQTFQNKKNNKSLTLKT